MRQRAHTTQVQPGGSFPSSSCICSYSVNNYSAYEIFHIHKQNHPASYAATCQTTQPPRNNSAHLLCIQYKSEIPQLRHFQIIFAVLEKPLTNHWINSKLRIPLRMPSTKILGTRAPTANAIHDKKSPSLKATICFTRWKCGNK